jgi:hypothetical protein
VAGRVRQPFTVCFHATPDATAAAPRPDQVETGDAAWFDPAQFNSLPVHPAMRHWLNDALMSGR